MFVAVVNRDDLLVFDLSRSIDLEMKYRCGSCSASCFPVGSIATYTAQRHTGVFLCVVVLLIQRAPAAQPAAFDRTLSGCGVNK